MRVPGAGAEDIVRVAPASLGRHLCLGQMHSAAKMLPLPLQKLGRERRWEQAQLSNSPALLFPRLGIFGEGVLPGPHTPWSFSAFADTHFVLSRASLLPLAKPQPFLKAHSNCCFFHVCSFSCCPSQRRFLPLNPSVVSAFYMMSSSPEFYPVL